MADEKLTAATRLEKILDNIAGGDNAITPATRLEKFLSYIAEAMEGGGGSGGGATTKYLIGLIPSQDLPEGAIEGYYTIDTAETIDSTTGAFYFTPQGPYENKFFYYPIGFFPDGPVWHTTNGSRIVSTPGGKQEKVVGVYDWTVGDFGNYAGHYVHLTYSGGLG